MIYICMSTVLSFVQKIAFYSYKNNSVEYMRIYIDSMDRQRAKINRRPSSFVFFFQWTALASPSSSSRSSSFLFRPSSPYPLLFSSTLAFWPAINPVVVGVRDYWNYYMAGTPKSEGLYISRFQRQSRRSRFVFIGVRVCVRTQALCPSLTLSFGGQQQPDITQEAETGMRTKGHEIMSHPSIRFRSIVRAWNILFRYASRVDHFYH